MYIRQRTLCILALALFVFASSGCNTQTIILNPVAAAADCTSHYEAKEFACGIAPCGLATMGSGCGYGTTANTLTQFKPPTEPLPVGWGDNNDNGTEPCPCWEWVSTYTRSHVRFEIPYLVNFDGFTYASLSWDQTQTEGNSNQSCLKSLYEATGPWKHGATPRQLIYDDLDIKAANGGYVGLIDLVSKWYAHPQQNYGLIFVPSRESIVSKSTSECVDTLTNLRLVLKYKTNAPNFPQ